jgi:hypothetical protein
MGLRTVDPQADQDNELGLEIDLYGELSAFASEPHDGHQAAVERIVLTPPALSETEESPIPDAETALDSNDSFDELGDLPIPETHDVGPIIEPRESAIVVENQPPLVSKEAVDLDIDVVEAPRVTERSGQITCGECGAVSSGDDLLCIGCGAFLGEFNGDGDPAQEPTPVEQEPMVPLCADCAAEVIPDEVFCPSCGAVLAG